MKAKLLSGILCLSFLFMGVSCKMAEQKQTSEKSPKSYLVKKAAEPITIDANWDKPAWADAEVGTLDFYMGEKPDHLPKTQFKVKYDSENIYVIFKVDDQYIKAVGQGYQAPVCLDSCAEFFFTPGDDVLQGYFNLEMNCGGTMLLYHQKERGVGSKPLADESLDQIVIAHTLPELIKEEITEPTTWVLEYKLPVSILEEYSAVAAPASGVVWKANFYKCGDNTSHPHWLTWSFVDKPNPDFHRPDFFGTLKFE